MNTPKILPQTFAVVTDQTRRGGVRVARVFVTADWPPMDAAQVEERGLRNLTHILPYARMAPTRRGLAKKLRAFLAKPAAAANRPRRVRGLWYADSAA